MANDLEQSTGTSSTGAASSEKSAEGKKRGFKFFKTGWQKREKETAQKKSIVLRPANTDHKTGLDQMIRVGDIMRILRNLVDHVILVVGQPTLNAVIRSSGGASVEIWTVPTLEAATNLDHCDITEMFMVVDLTDENKIKMIAQSDFADVSQWEPVAVFLSPFPSTELNQELFAKCVDKVVRHKQVWSKSTAVNAVAKSALIEKEEYPDDASKAALVDNLKKLWEADPICTTMPIRVWQMYIVKSNKGRPEDAAAKILQVIPAKCDRCLPSELWDILENTSAWTELRHSNYHTTVSLESWKDDNPLDPLNHKSFTRKTCPEGQVETINVSTLGHSKKKCCGCFARRQTSQDSL